MVLFVYTPRLRSSINTDVIFAAILHFADMNYFLCDFIHYLFTSDECFRIEKNKAIVDIRLHPSLVLPPGKSV